MKLAKSVTALLLLACLTLSGHSTQVSANQQSEAQAKLSSEVRLRKLHLVRPDLIGYPIVYEVYC